MLKISSSTALVIMRTKCDLVIVNSRADDRRMINISRLYSVIKSVDHIIPFYDTWWHNIPKTTDKDNISSLTAVYIYIMRLITIYQLTKFGIFHHCIMINVATYLQLLFCLRKHMEMTNHGSAVHKDSQ